MHVSILIMVDELQHISTVTIRDLLQYLEFLKSLTAFWICGIQVTLVNQFDSDLHKWVFMLRQNHFAKAAFAKQTELMVLRTKVLDALTIPDLF